ncbi:MAG: hypothetical protein IE927_04455 [Rhodobacterales bacterium]|nr:hypothetical protein [Rhodobacterales bacterium]
MNLRSAAPLALMFALTACGGNSLNNVDPGTGGGTDGGIDSERQLPPGTESPTRNTDIVRYEAQDDEGSGYVTSVSYDRATDTFTVDNLAFDGDNAYQRGVAVGSLGPYAVYESDSAYVDSQTGAPIGQFTHRAIYGVSRTGETEFAIVRTGSYVGYGFGGFVYERNGSVTLPTEGQALFQGDYAALRDFQGRGGLEYVIGDMAIAIDFDDFNSGAAVRGKITNRAIFDINGRDITADVLAALTEDTNVTQSVLPTVVFQVGPGTLDANGEMVGQADSSVVTDTGALETFESGNFYAVLSGEGAQEVTGIIVLTADDPRYDGVTARETGGFILYRE